MYHNKSKVLGEKALANTVDPDQMSQNMASDQGLLFANHPAVFLDTLADSKMDWFKV